MALGAKTKQLESLRQQGRWIPNLRNQIIEMMAIRQWSLSWIHRSAYLHLEAAELAEAVRGKHGDTLKESADVLITLLALSPHSLEDIIPVAVNIVAELRTKPRYASEAGTWTDNAPSPPSAQYDKETK
jgi:NTP pyrophosphatase (non-canonical NTP hydrolase)